MRISTGFYQNKENLKLLFRNLPSLHVFFQHARMVTLCHSILSTSCYRWPGDRMIGIAKVETLIPWANFEYLGFHTIHLNLQTRAWIFSWVVGKPHQCVTPRTILKHITAERKEKFGTEKAISEIVRPTDGELNVYLSISLDSAAENWLNNDIRVQIGRVEKSCSSFFNMRSSI